MLDEITLFLVKFISRSSSHFVLICVRKRKLLKVYFIMGSQMKPRLMGKSKQTVYYFINLKLSLYPPSGGDYMSL